MTIHQSIDDMTATALSEDDEMARRITPRQMLRGKNATSGGVAAKKIVANAYRFDDGTWGAQFAIPGLMVDFTRNQNGDIDYFDTEEEAEIEAMRAAIGMFNAPRDRMATGRRGRVSDTRPKKLDLGEFRALIMQVEGITNTDIAFLLDKPLKRIVGWLGDEQDVPHEIRVLVETWVRFDASVDLAFEVTNAALDHAEPRE